MDYILHKLILGNKDKTDLQFIVQLLVLSGKVFKTALSKKTLNILKTNGSDI